MLNRFSSPFNWLWVLWVFVTLVGFTISFISGLTLLSGVLIGIGQWTILRTKLPGARSWLWIPATAIGIPLGFLIGVLDFIALEWNFDFPYMWISYFIVASVAGAITGALQWLALYRKLEGSNKWVLVSAVSWGIGITIALLVFDTGGSNIGFELGKQLGPGVLTGIIVGAISGIFVESTLVHPKHESKSSFQNAS